MKYDYLNIVVMRIYSLILYIGNPFNNTKISIINKSKLNHE